MGWASKLLHIGEAAAGVGLLIGTGGAAAPYATGLIAGGAGGLAQDFAGDKAEKQQKEATTAAQKIGNDALAEQRQLLSPTANLAQGAGMNLASLMGGGFAQAPSAAAGVSGPTSLSSLNQGSTFGDPGTGNPPSDAPTRRVPMVQMNPDGSQATDSPVQPLNGSSFVRMRAPTGEEEDVPPQLVDHFAQQGAVPV